MPDTQEQTAIDAKHDEIAEVAAAWTDEQFATKIVELLIHDKGIVNKWQRTIETMVKVARKRDVIRVAEAETA